MRPSAVARAGRVRHPGEVIDVVPVGGGVWLARCECDATQRFNSAEAGWAWVLAHPCPDPSVIDLTHPTDSRCD